MADTTISQLTTTNTLLATSYVPVSDGTTTTKLATDSLLGFRNRIINGDMRIDQRNAGASVAWAANTAGYTADRFKQTQNGTVASTIQQTTDVPAAQGFTNSLSRTITTAEPAVASGNKTCGYYYMLEGYNVSDFLWGTASAKSITISFWVKSSVTGTFSFSVMNTTFTRSYNSSYSISAANTWEKKTFTVPGDTGATSIDKTSGNGIQLVFDLGYSSIYESSTANTWQDTISYALAGCVKLSSTLGATFYLTGLQLEAGSTATPFERRFIGNELAMCQRYYQLHGNGVNGNSSGLTTNFEGGVVFPIEMRRAPDFTLKNTSIRMYAGGGYDNTATASIIGNQSTTSKGSVIQLNGWPASSTFDQRGARLLTDNCLAFNAEL